MTFLQNKIKTALFASFEPRRAKALGEASLKNGEGGFSFSSRRVAAYFYCVDIFISIGECGVRFF